MTQLPPHKLIYLVWGAMFAITLCLGVYFHSSAEERIVYSQTHNLGPLPKAEATHVVFTVPIELKSRQNLLVAVSAGIDNSWAWVDCDFINDRNRDYRRVSDSRVNRE